MAILKVPVTQEDHLQGNENAHVMLVEYGDYECPYCSMAYPVVKELQKQFGGQLGFIFRNFPLTEVHPLAEVAAETAEFAGVHRHFWAMHDLIYENQKSLSKELLFSLAEGIGLNTMELERSLQEHLLLTRVKNDFLGGVRSGVNGTPTFFINGNRYNGMLNLDHLSAAIEAAMLSKTV